MLLVLHIFKSEPANVGAIYTEQFLTVFLKFSNLIICYGDFASTLKSKILKTYFMRFIQIKDEIKRETFFKI